MQGTGGSRFGPLCPPSPPPPQKKSHTTVTLQCLCHFLRLQVPNIHHIIFWSWHYPLKIQVKRQVQIQFSTDKVKKRLVFCQSRYRWTFNNICQLFFEIELVHMNSVKEITWQWSACQTDFYALLAEHFREFTYKWKTTNNPEVLGSSPIL